MYANPDNHEILSVEEGTLIITTGYDKTNHYHSGIANEPLMYEAVVRYIGTDAGKLPDRTNQTKVNFDTNHWTMVNAAYNESQNCIILTEDYKKWQNGSIWYNTPVPGNFVLEMDYYTGGTEGSFGGADGIVVAFYADKDRTRLSGLDIGFSGCQGYGIELDTYYNDERNDPYEHNHIALVKEHVGNHLVADQLLESEDEQWHHLKVVVENGVCEAFVDGVSKISAPVTPTGHPWLGITSSTGEGHNLHAVKNISLTHN